jgi:arylsulfatase
MIAMLAIGGLLGFATASGKLDLFGRASEKQPQPSVTDKASSPAEAAAACCAEGLSKGQLLAMADPKVKEAVARAEEKSGKKPNILFIMGDDVGWFNIGAYHRGIMSGKTPNLDKLASQGMLFTDYYAEASCTAGRASFITGQIPLRTGLTTVGQAGADVGMPAQACTIATALKSLGYATGQFGKNHLGDLNKYLPTLHGFDEFHGYLYHLDALSDPYWFSYPKDPAFRAKYGPRDVLHCWAEISVLGPTAAGLWEVGYLVEPPTRLRRNSGERQERFEAVPSTYSCSRNSRRILTQRCTVRGA